jgi:hypothetical protein
MKKPIQYHGFPVSAFVRHKKTGHVGQVEHPYTAAGEDIIRSGKILVSGFSLFSIWL